MSPMVTRWAIFRELIVCSPKRIWQAKEITNFNLMAFTVFRHGVLWSGKRKKTFVGLTDAITRISWRAPCLTLVSVHWILNLELGAHHQENSVNLDIFPTKVSTNLHNRISCCTHTIHWTRLHEVELVSDHYTQRNSLIFEIEWS